MELKEDSRGHNESPRAETGRGSNYFWCTNPFNRIQPFGIKHMTRSSRKTQGKVKRVREWSTSENFAETKEFKHNGEGGNRCNQDGSKMLQNKEDPRGHSEGKEES